jgi:hypothetical protein
MRLSLRRSEAEALAVAHLGSDDPELRRVGEKAARLTASQAPEPIPGQIDIEEAISHARAA